MGHAASILNGGGTITPPDGYVTPSFPSLTSWTLDLKRLEDPTTELADKYLYYAKDIYTFTLFWLLIFHGVVFCLPGLWFTLVILFSPTSSLSLAKPSNSSKSGAGGSAIGGDGSSRGGRTRSGSGGKLRRRGTSGQQGEGATSGPSLPGKGRQDEQYEMTDRRNGVGSETVGSSQEAGGDVGTTSPPGLGSRRRASLGDWWRRGSLSGMNRQGGPVPSADESNGITGTSPTTAEALPSVFMPEEDTPIATPDHQSASTKPSKPTSRPHPSQRTRRPGPPFYLAYTPFLLFTAWGMASAVVMATIIGFTLSAVYNTANFRMSTWIPFLCAVMETTIVVITSYSAWTTIL